MSKLNTESKMDFDYSVGTEDRFALRKWFTAFIAAQNGHNADEIISYLADDTVVEGLGGLIDYQKCADFIRKRCAKSQSLVMTYPEAKFKYQHVLFHVRGSFEGYDKGVLSYAGTFEMKVIKIEEAFKVTAVKLYPTMIVKD